MAELRKFPSYFAISERPSLGDSDKNQGDMHRDPHPHSQSLPYEAAGRGSEASGTWRFPPLLPPAVVCRLPHSPDETHKSLRTGLGGIGV